MRNTSYGLKQQPLPLDCSYIGR